MGGLSRKAYQIQSLRKQHRQALLFLDSGALFFATPRLPGGLDGQQKNTAMVIARAMKKMGCQGVGIGPQDLAGGITLLKEIQHDTALPLLSLNLVDKTTKKLIFPPSVSRSVANMQITIVGLTDQSSPVGPEADYAILPWQQLLADYIAGIESSSDMIILLSSYPNAVNQEIARTIPAISLILESGHCPANQSPRRTGNALICHTGPRGKQLGMMKISWNKSRQWGPDRTAQLNREKRKLAYIKGQLQQYKNGMVVDPTTNTAYQRLLTAQQKSRQKAIRLQDLQATTPQPCTFTSTFFTLQPSLPKDLTVERILQQGTTQPGQKKNE